MSTVDQALPVFSFPVVEVPQARRGGIRVA